MVKILIVLTNHDRLGDTGKKTGWYLPEVAHPYDTFKKAGHDITFLTPKGGDAPMDPGSREAFKDDEICQTFLANDGIKKKLTKTEKPTDINISEYKVIFYAGGHGPMFDLPDNKEVASLATKIYESGGIIGAVCHGTVGLVPVKLSSGEAIVNGKDITSFTNKEEDAVELSGAMPFLLETKLRELGANFVAVENFKKNVQVSDRVVTGQNPASATGVAETINNLL